MTRAICHVTGLVQGYFSTRCYPLRSGLFARDYSLLDLCRSILYAVVHFTLDFLACVYAAGLPGLCVCVFFEDVAIDALMFTSAPGPFGDRGGMPRWGLMMAMSAPPRCLFLRSTSDAIPWSLFRGGSWSSRPQPLGSGGDAAPCEDPREEHGPQFNF